MKTNQYFLFAVVVVSVLFAGPVRAQISGINSGPSSATIKFDDSNSFNTPNFGGLYSTPTLSPWNGSTLTLSQTDLATGDAANGDLSAFGSGASYNVALNNVSLSQPVGNTGYADLIFNFSVQFQVGSTWNSAPTLFPNFLVSGTVQGSSGYAKVRGNIDYYGVNTAGTYGLLDSVIYGWGYTTPGSFSNQPVNGTANFGTLGNLVAGTTFDMVGSLTFEVDPATFTVTTVPEPGTMALLGLGAAGGFILRRRKS